MTATIIDPMSIATEAVKKALIGVTQDGGCKPETIALVHEAVNTWEHVESEAHAALKKELAEAHHKIQALEDALNERRAMHREAEQELERARTNVRHWKENCGKLDAQLKVTKEEHNNVTKNLRDLLLSFLPSLPGGTLERMIADTCYSRQSIERELDDIKRERRQEIRISFDKIKSEFVVTFWSGQELRFDNKPKTISGNIENWLANLRHRITQQDQ